MTSRQLQVYNFIRGRIEATGIAPSYEEIARACGLKSRGSAHSLVGRLIEDGKLIRRPNRVRGLALPLTDLSSVSTSQLVAELESRGWRAVA